MEVLTPLERRRGLWLKRDDLFTFAGVRGGKVRSARAVASREPVPKGLVTAGSRHSPQVEIVAHVGAALGLPVACVVPAGELTPELESAERCGAELVPVRPGHNSVIVARARNLAADRGWREVPFGMECREAITATAAQVESLRPVMEGVRRVVVPVGSGMTLAGVCEGLGLLAKRHGILIPHVVGVVVGALPERRLDRWCPGWRLAGVELIEAGVDYHTRVDRSWAGVELDPVYEAKAVPHLRPDDVFWIVGRRGAVAW